MTYSKMRNFEDLTERIRFGSLLCEVRRIAKDKSIECDLTEREIHYAEKHLKKYSKE